MGKIAFALCLALSVISILAATAQTLTPGNDSGNSSTRPLPAIDPIQAQIDTAKAKYDQALNKAQHDCMQAIAAADQTYIDDLNAAIKQAMLDQDLPTAEKLDDARKQALLVQSLHKADIGPAIAPTPAPNPGDDKGSPPTPLGDTVPPSEKKAAARYDQAASMAKDDFLQAVLVDDQTYIDELDAAVKQAMQNQDLPGAKKLDGVRKQVLIAQSQHKADQDAIETPELKAARAAMDAEKSAKIASLLQTAKSDDSKEKGHEALAALDDLLKLDPGNAEAKDLRDKIYAYYPPKTTVEIPLPPPGLTDDQIGDAITRASDFLLKQFNNNAELPADIDYHEGMDSLAVYALLQAGLATGDKRLDQHAAWTKNAINTMNHYEFKREDHVQTYSHALRAAALAVYDRDEDRSTLDTDVAWLLKNQVGGAYTYTDEFSADNMYWDNSNSQYGLLGVWSGAEVNIFVKPNYWRQAQSHWIYSQLGDGTWSYSQADQVPRKSMTLAGIASLYVAQDYLSTPNIANQIGRPPFSPPLQKALDWLEEGDNGLVDLQREVYGSYTLYGLERVGLASGFKYFGKHDWFREMAPEVINLQNPDGSWGTRNTPDLSDSIRDTSYFLLFLARGRNPILMNKLRYDGNWDNRPHDAANLARYASNELDRPLNWQVVPAMPPNDWRDWTESRVLYMAGDCAPYLSDISDLAVNNLRQYILHGGLLLTQSDDPKGGFGQYIQQLGHRLFPQYDWTDLPADSTLLTCQYRIKDLKVPVRIISNGSRILMIYWPQDVAVHWEMRDERSAEDLFKLGVNVALYSCGKDMKNRVNTDPVIPSYVSANDAVPLHIASLRYDGNCDPEPIAFDRAARWFHQKTSLDVRVDSTSLETVDVVNPAIAHLTGTAHVQFTDAQVQAVKKYVNGGGVLLVDPCGTPGDFLNDVCSNLLGQAFPDQHLVPIQADHPLLNADNNGMHDLTPIGIRPFTASIPGYTNAYPQEFTSGRGHVIVLPIDMTSGLAGCDTWGIAGYTPAYSLRLFQNIVLWVWNGAKD